MQLVPDGFVNGYVKKLKYNCDNVWYMTHRRANKQRKENLSEGMHNNIAETNLEDFCICEASSTHQYFNFIQHFTRSPVRGWVHIYKWKI